MKAIKERGLSSLDILVHDLKSPLGNIRASADLLLQTPAEGREKVIERIVRQSEKGLHLIGETLSHRERPSADLDMQMIRLRPFLEACIADQQTTMQKKKIRLFLAQGEDISCLANALYLAQIMDNLVENAWKYSLEGGTIEISYEETKVFADEPNWHALVVHVKDYGRGIPADRLPFVFLEHFQVAIGEHEMSYGLGLAICKKFCEYHGGTIWVNSELGRGSTFSFLLPWIEAEEK